MYRPVRMKRHVRGAGLMDRRYGAEDNFLLLDEQGGEWDERQFAGGPDGREKRRKKPVAGPSAECSARPR